MRTRMTLPMMTYQIKKDEVVEGTFVPSYDSEKSETEDESDRRGKKIYNTSFEKISAKDPIVHDVYSEDPKIPNDEQKPEENLTTDSRVSSDNPDEEKCEENNTKRSSKLLKVKTENRKEGSSNDISDNSDEDDENQENNEKEEEELDDLDNENKMTRS